MSRIYTEADIVHERPNFWVLDCKARGFEVYRIGITHSTRMGSFGTGAAYRQRAIDHCDKLQKEHDEKSR